MALCVHRRLFLSSPVGSKNPVGELFWEAELCLFCRDLCCLGLLSVWSHKLFLHPSTFSSPGGGVCLWLVGSEPFREVGDGALSLPWLTVMWGNFSCCVQQLCLAALSKEWTLFSFSFQRGTGPAFKIDNVSTYCQGRIETVILIWHRHLFLMLAEAPKSERSSGLTHSFHQLFLLLSYLTAETWVSAI